MDELRPSTPLYLPESLLPLTIHRQLAPHKSIVHKTQPLFSYSYYEHVPSQDGQLAKQEKVVKVWESPIEGMIQSWQVNEGQRISQAGSPILHILEPCTHDVQLHGLCALCGKDLTVTDYTGFSDTSRAAISMVHDVGGLTVSMEEAHRLESATTARLLASRKLSLIVDLDQTIVHATVDPTVGEWLRDPRNPNYKALEGVKKFKLGQTGSSKAVQPSLRDGTEADQSAQEDEDDAGQDTADGDSCWYYVKMRPGLKQFLESVSELYEMHVYTMGTRAYAIEVCNVIDPDGGLFGGRILSRDESGSLTRKSLQRLFPCDTNMVVIIDDRADVWDGSPNLVKVIPYEFFVGIGDINAAYLPKKRELTATPPGAAPSSAQLATSTNTPSPSSATSEELGSGDDPASAATSVNGDVAAGDVAVESKAAELRGVDLIVNPSGAEFPSLSTAESSIALTIHDQIESRPLRKAQAEAHHSHPHRVSSGHAQAGTPTPLSDLPSSSDVDDEEVTDVAEDNDEEVEADAEEEEAVLKDDDRELDRVFDILKSVRDQFYTEVDKGAKDADVKNIIPALKASVFTGLNFVFSGLVALGSRPQDSEYWKLATTFGAGCAPNLDSRSTHLVAKEAGTAKVHAARRLAPSRGLQIVFVQWLLDCAAQWRRLPEEPYLLPPPSPVPPQMESGFVVGYGSRDGGGDQRSTTPPLAPRDGLQDGVDDGNGDDDGQGDNLRDLDEIDEPELDMGEIDWGDAAAEMEDLLNDTDADDGTGDEADSTAGDSELDGDESDAAGSKPGNVGQVRVGGNVKKRARLSTGTDSEDDDQQLYRDGAGGRGQSGSGGGKATAIKGAAADASDIVVGSPLQKRVKRSRARKSGLAKSSFPSALISSEGNAENETEARSTTGHTAGSPREAGLSNNAAAGSGEGIESGPPSASQASSSFDSDDEAFLASMAADLEKGWA